MSGGAPSIEPPVPAAPNWVGNLAGANGELPASLPHPDQIVSLFTEMPNFKNGSISYPNFEDWQRMNRSFTAIAAYRSTGFNLTGNGEPERLHGEMISAGFFEIFGVNPLLGRTFSENEDRIGANPTVMITEGLWKRRFGSDPNIIGQRMILNGVGRSIIGVVPSSFHLHIQNFQRYWNSKDWIYTFTQEWPVDRSPRHQLSYTLAALHAGDQPASGAGFGDVILNYRYQLLGNGEAKVAFAPRFSVLLSTGDYRFERSPFSASLRE